MSIRLYVGNLSFEVDAGDLDELFGLFGGSNSEIATRGDSPRSLGFGFVGFSTDAEADRAVTHLNGRNVAGRELRVRRARENAKAGD